MKSPTEEVHCKSTLVFKLPNCTPGSRTGLKQLYAPAWMQNGQGHHHNTGTNHKIQRGQAERSENCKPTTGQDPPLFQIQTALLAHSPKGSLLWNENTQGEQLFKSQDSCMNQSEPLGRFNSGPAGFTQTQVLLTLPFTHSCCFPYCQEHRAQGLRQ